MDRINLRCLTEISSTDISSTDISSTDISVRDISLLLNKWREWLYDNWREWLFLMADAQVQDRRMCICHLLNGTKNIPSEYFSFHTKRSKGSGTKWRCLWRVGFWGFGNGSATYWSVSKSYMPIGRPISEVVWTDDFELASCKNEVKSSGTFIRAFPNSLSSTNLLPTPPVMQDPYQHHPIHDLIAAKEAEI